MARWALPNKLKVVWVVVFAVCLRTASAGDEKSIMELRDALVALAPDVDPHEAELVSVTAHTTSRELARKYRIVLNPSFQNFMVNIGAREKGYCAHYARDIGLHLKELRLKTLVLHWGAAYAKEPDESNCLVVTARKQPFQNGIILDGWRRAGRLLWCPLMKDYEYQVDRSSALNRLGGQHHSGITAWKEDLQESTWLQDTRPASVTAKRN